MSDVKIIDRLNPSAVTDKQGLADFLGNTRSVLQQLDGDQAATKKAIADLSSKMQEAIERSQAVAAPDIGDEAGLQKYVNADGSVRLQSERRSFQFAGKEYHQQTEAGLLDDRATHGTWHSELKQAVTDRNLARLLMRRPNTPKLDAKVASVLSKAPAGIRDNVERAFYNGAGVGAEWIPEQFLPNLYEEFEIPRNVAGLFSIVPMTSDTVRIPKLSTGARPYIKGRVTTDNPTDYTGSTPVTADSTINITGLACRIVADEADAEDSAIAAVQNLQRIAVQAINDGYEDCLINGDSAATHQDAIASWNIRSRWGSTGLGGSADHRRAFLGLRAHAFDNSSTRAQNTEQDGAGIGTLIGTLGERAASDLVVLVSPEVMFQKLATDTNLMFLDKLGPQATIINGQIGSLFGHPVVMTRFLSADMNASGLFDNVTTTRSGVLAVDRSAWSHYERRGVLAEVDKDISSGAINIVVTLRRTFATLTSQASAAFGYNWLA